MGHHWRNALLKQSPHPIKVKRKYLKGFSLLSNSVKKKKKEHNYTMVQYYFLCVRCFTTAEDIHLRHFTRLMGNYQFYTEQYFYIVE